MYKTLTHPNLNGDIQTSIIRQNENGSFTSFPAEPSNPNYEHYLKWLAEGNTPEPADEENT